MIHIVMAIMVHVEVHEIQVLGILHVLIGTNG